MAATSGSTTTMGASACLRGALKFAWYRDAPAARTSHLVLALAACGDPVSRPALAEAGITYRAMCGVLGEGEAPVSGDEVAAEILADIARDVGPPRLIARLLRTSPSSPRRPAPPWTRGVLGVEREALTRRLEELHRPDGPGPILADLGRRPSADVDELRQTLVRTMR